MNKEYVGIGINGMKISGVLLGILAVAAGVLILTGLLSLGIVTGIFLIVFGLITLVRR